MQVLTTVALEQMLFYVHFIFITSKIESKYVSLSEVKYNQNNKEKNSEKQCITISLSLLKKLYLQISNFIQVYRNKLKINSKKNELKNCRGNFCWKYTLRKKKKDAKYWKKQTIDLNVSNCPTKNLYEIYSIPHFIIYFEKIICYWKIFVISSLILNFIFSNFYNIFFRVFLIHYIEVWLCAKFMESYKSIVCGSEI